MSSTRNCVGNIAIVYDTVMVDKQHYAFLTIHRALEQRVSLNILFIQKVGEQQDGIQAVTKECKCITECMEQPH